MNQPVSLVINRRPRTALAQEDKQNLLERMKRLRLRHMPLIDEVGRLVGLETLADLLQRTGRDNWVVLMAGGEGLRLRPLTNETPKPMLPVGSRPLLETILESFISAGFRQFFFSVNYKAKLVEEYFGDGTSRGVDIQYLREGAALGTAGSLCLLPEMPSTSFFVMNGDILTNANFGHVLDFHRDHEAAATMCVYQYKLQVPYGVVAIDGHRLTAIEEKPTIQQFINAGIYVLEPHALKLVAEGVPMTMPNLFETLMSNGQSCSVCPIREYWLDVGHTEDLQRANTDFQSVFDD